MNTALLPMPRQQFFSAAGKPLAGGKLYSYSAGTSTPLAVYTDQSGNTPHPNPVVLDAGGGASVWLGAAAYKLVLTDAAGVQQWTVDGVSSVSLAQLQGNTTLETLTVEGGANVGGALQVDGTLTTSSLDVAGSASIGGHLGAQTATVAGNAEVQGAATLASVEVTGATVLDGTLGVTGLATFASVKIGAATLSDFVNGLIPAQAAASIRSEAGYFILKVPRAGGYFEIGFGSGTISNGSSLPLPAGFAYSQMASIISPHDIRADPSSNDNSLSLEQNTINADGSVSMYQQGTAGNRWPVSGSSTSQTANWLAIIWRSL